MRTRWFAVGAVLAAAVLAGCGGGGNSSGGGSSSTTAAGGHTITVTETEYKLALNTTSVSPGKYTFVAKDAGGATHALEIDGPGVSDKATGTVNPGQSTQITVTLQKGTYTLYCPVDGHRKLGMETTLTVG